jgi:hypothetical protein
MTTEYPRFQLNRGLVVLRYKQPYIDWVRTAGELPMDLTLENANDDNEAFLVPSFDSPIDPVDGTEDAIKWVEKRWRMFFEHILSSWILDEAEWPKKRTLKMFREWFDVEYKSMVWDMGNEPLIFEEWDDEDEFDDGSLLH